MKTTPLTHRLAAALASTLITFALFSAVVAEAEAPAGCALLAQSAAPVVR